MWQSILKAPITIGRTRIGMKPMPEEEDECNRELKAYADKLKNMKLVYGDLGYTEQKADSHYGSEPVRNYTRAIHEGDLDDDIEQVYFYYTPIPEEVACGALEILRNESSPLWNSIGDYDIHFDVWDELEITSVFLQIFNTKSTKTVVHLQHSIEGLEQNEKYPEYKENYVKHYDAYKNANIDWR